MGGKYRIGIDSLVQPYAIVLYIVVVLLLFFWALTSLQFGGGTFFGALGLFLLAVVSFVPDRFRPFISLSLGTSVVVVFAVSYGAVVGVVVGAILQAIYIYIGKFYYPTYIVRSMVKFPLVTGFLPTLFAVGPENIAVVGMALALLMFLVGLPIRLFLVSETPLPQYIASSLFGVYWQYIILSLYGAAFLNLLS